MNARVYSIGHSTRSLPEFIGLLKRAGISTLVDVRRYPSSRRWPHFSKDNLVPALAREDIAYVWMEGLGGRRNETPAPGSPNAGLTTPAFRSYADHMLTELFRRTIAALLAEARRAPTAIMCAERLWWKCHRLLICDYLTAHGVEVFHLGVQDEPVRHTLSTFARVEGERLTYPAPQQPTAP